VPANLAGDKFGDFPENHPENLGEFSNCAEGAEFFLAFFQ
jgi:hypothetical protein